MGSDVRVLILEDRADDAELLVAELRRSGYRPRWSRVETREELVAALDDPPDVVISDYSLPTMTAPDALRLLQDLHLEVPVIVVSGVMDEETCVTSLRLGAVDYLLKDRLTRLGPAVDHALSRRRMAEEARRAREQRQEALGILAGVVQHAPAAIYVRDVVDGRLLRSNARYEQLLRALAAPPEGAAAADPAGSREREVTLRVDGEDRTYLSVRYPVTDGTGRMCAIGGLLVDVTRQKQVEQRLRELDRMKTEFVASVSHELRTPLTSICGYAEMLADATAGTPAPEVQQSMLGVIGRNSQRLLALVDDLMVLSRIDSGALVLADQQVEVLDLVRSATEVLRPASVQAGVRLVADVPDGLPALAGDRGQLERVLLNLMSNAIKFTERDGEVLVAARVRGGDLVVEVRDSGIGIPAADLSRLFTRFYRSETARRKAIQGTGLGLAVAAGIVGRHGGRIDVHSTEGVGTTMSVVLPIGRARSRTAAAAEVEPAVAVA